MQDAPKSSDIGIRTTLTAPYQIALQLVTDALKVEGFGILTQIDVQATMKTKINADFRRFMILDACNPPLALRALNADLDVGLLLPCNVTVYEEGEGSVVAAVDPVGMLGMFKDNPAARDVAVDARARLQRAIASLVKQNAR